MESLRYGYALGKPQNTIRITSEFHFTPQLELKAEGLSNVLAWFMFSTTSIYSIRCLQPRRRRDKLKLKEPSRGSDDHVKFMAVQVSALHSVTLHRMDAKEPILLFDKSIGHAVPSVGGLTNYACRTPWGAGMIFDCKYLVAKIR